jgi:3-hydroxyacyl-[acyl-carrier-protein] dehydratase
MEMLIKSLYEVTSLEKSETGFRAEIHLNKDHDVFKGHFPGNPVMPGVCMIQIIKELTEESLSKSLFLTRSSNIKFMAIINPEKDPNILLEIDWTQEEGQVKIKALAKAKEVVALKLSAEFKILT